MGWKPTALMTLWFPPRPPPGCSFRSCCSFDGEHHSLQGGTYGRQHSVVAGLTLDCCFVHAHYVTCAFNECSFMPSLLSSHGS
uniref:Uncharacterized protein n=1 Tax=Picea glauca TaxID=3330 RepID=A0A101LYW6_PICGL|nr:hypothetical protein ABT39_MTgene5930 [Picea glauca]QHR92030.1 hypothetical protein Q903MT_gene6066 [Picea sitchensis]